MIDMLCKTSIFVRLENDSCYQMCGIPLSEQPLARRENRKRKRCSELLDTPNKRYSYGKHKTRTSREITIVRSRLFYGRPALNAKGGIIFGLHHIHALNRFAKLAPQEQIKRLLTNLFPLQYKLHNVFSSEVDRKETAQPFKDYTMRNNELARQTRRPKCLPLQILQLISALLHRHHRTSYRKILEYHCPDKTKLSHADVSSVSLLSSLSRRMTTQRQIENSVSSSVCEIESQNETKLDHREVFTNYANSPRSVAAFVIAIVKSVMPVSLIGLSNLDILADHIRVFVGLRRFESMTLQHFMSGISYKKVPWLVTSDRMDSLSETRKREELISELVYWMIDSFVLPLLKTNFYITESHLFRNRVLYFRHDVWKRLTEPELARIRLGMLCEVPVETAVNILKKRDLGFAYVRLLPKGRGVRPITNLRRRAMSKDGTKRTKSGHLLPSINSIMQCVHSVLRYEHTTTDNSTSFGIGSVDEMYMRLKKYKLRHNAQNPKRKLYFAKVDVKNCFDTIEQDKVLDIVSQVLAEDEYMLQKFCAVVPDLGRVGRKYHTRAVPAQDLQDFDEFASEWTRNKKHIVLIDGVTYQIKSQSQIRYLLNEHIKNHLIKIGKKFYRQDTGIPQGSILSTILCDFYYTDMESKILSFMNRSDSACFRLIDDFLYITEDRESAERFLNVMHGGNPDYGCFVSSNKSLANFEVTVLDERIQTIAGSAEFPVSHIKYECIQQLC